uniref:Chitin-binding type-2 domain-containing protein n=1 Tax=Panagrolaimus superbus TaxID=310955 RepID=A0A914ZDS0_9BILA
MIKWLICLLAVGAFTYGNAFRSGTGQQMKPKLNCTEVGNGNFVYGCSKVFWMCSNGILYSQQCHSELFFDPVSNACEREENIELCNTQNSTDLHKPSKATEAFNCKGKVDSAYELAPCLYRFAHCKNGFVFYEGCPTGTVYDDNKKYCDWPANVAGCQDKERLSSRSPLDGETAAASPGYGPDDVPPPSIIHQQSAYGRQFKLGSSPVGASEQNDTLQHSSPTHSPPIQQQQPVGPPHTEHRQKQPQPPQQKQQQKLSEQLSLKNEFDCTGKKDGTYPTPQNACATFFYKCSLNETYKYNCPHGLYFSTQKVHCEFLSKTPECNGHVLPYPNGPLAAPPANYTKIPVQASPYPPSNSNQQQSGASNINAKPALKVDFNCRDKADGFYAIGKCRNDYIRCVHKTSYLQECPKNFVFEADILTVPPQSNGQQQVQSSLQLPQQPVVPAPPSQSYTFKQAQQRAINQTQNSYIHAPSTAVSSQSKQQDMPQKSSSSYDPQQPLYSQQQQSEGYLQNHRYTEVKPKPQSERIYAQPKSQTEGSHSQQTPPVAQIRDTFCQDKGLVHGYYSSGCSSYYFACVPRNTIKVPCPANLFYDSETEKCDYKTNVPACGGSRPSQQQPQSPPAYGQSNTQASLVVAHQQENQPSQQQQNSSVVTQPRHQSASPQLQQLYDDHNSQQDIIHKSANLRSFIQNSEVYQPIQSSIVQQQPAAPTPAPAWVPYSGQQQIRQPEIQRNQMPAQQPASNPAPAW